MMLNCIAASDKPNQLLCTTHNSRAGDLEHAYQEQMANMVDTECNRVLGIRLVGTDASTMRRATVGAAQCMNLKHGSHTDPCARTIRHKPSLSDYRIFSAA